MRAAYEQLLAQALWSRRLQGSLWPTWLILGLAFIALLLPLLLGKWQIGLLMFDVLTGCMAFMWWGMVVRISVAQNLPSHACLVPQLRQRLMRMVTLTFCAGAVVLAALGAAAFGHFGYLLTAIALMLPFTLLVQRYNWLGFLPSLLIFSNASWKDGPMRTAWSTFASIGEAPASLAALAAIALLSAWSLQVAFPRGGDAHAEWHRKYLQKMERMNGGVRKDLSAAWGGWLPASRSGIAAGDPVERIIQQAVGTSVSGSATRVLVLGALGGMLIQLPYLLLTVPRPSFHISPWSLELVLLLTVPIALQSLVSAISRRSGEQSLLRLAPAMVAPERINAVLARLSVRIFCRMWAIAAFGILAVEWLEAGHWFIDGPVLLLVVLPLPFCSMLLRDYAAAQPQDAFSDGGMILIMLLTIGIAALLRWQLPSACIYLALLIVACSARVLHTRWRAMLRAPVAFPAGRLA